MITLFTFQDPEWELFDDLNTFKSLKIIKLKILFNFTKILLKCSQMDYVEEVHINYYPYDGPLPVIFETHESCSSEEKFKKVLPKSMKNIKKIVIESSDISLIERLRTYDLSNFPYEIKISKPACIPDKYQIDHFRFNSTIGSSSFQAIRLL